MTSNVSNVVPLPTRPQPQEAELQWQCECKNQTFTIWESGDVHCTECGKLNYRLRFNPADIEVMP